MYVSFATQIIILVMAVCYVTQQIELYITDYILFMIKTGITKTFLCNLPFLRGFFLIVSK